MTLNSCGPLGGRFDSDLVSYKDYMKETRPMYAFDAGHFNVRGGAWPGDVSGQRGRVRTTVEVLRQGLDYLAGAKDAEVPIWQERENAAALGGGVVEDDGSRVCDAVGRRGYDALGLLYFCGRKTAIDFPVEAGREPRGRESGGGNEAVLAAGRELGGDDGGKLRGRALDYFGIIFAQALDHQFEAGFGGQTAAADVGPRQGFICLLMDGLSRGADAVEDLGTRLILSGGQGHFASLDWDRDGDRDAHQSWKVWSGRPRKSRVWVHLAPMLGRE